LALNFLLMRYSVIGELDHHVVECLFAPVAMLFAWRLDLVGPRRAALFGLATALMVWISSSAVFVWAGLALLFSLRELRADRLKKFLSFGLAGTAMLALLAGINGVLGRPVWSVAQPSAFHVLIWCGLWSVVSLRALRLSLGPLIIAIGCICAGLLVIADFRAHFWAAWSYIFNPQGMLESVLETKSPLFEGDQFVTGYIHLNLGYLGWLLVLAPLLLLLWRRFTGAQRDLLIMVLTLWPFALAQSRFLHLVVPVFLIGLAAIVDRITGSMHQRGIRFSRAVVVGFGILTIAPAVSVGFRLDHHESDFRDLKAARTVASALGITPDLRWQRLALRVMPQTGVFVGPDQGHILSYMTGLGVTANSFNHGWAGQQRIFLQASSAEEFKQVAFKARVEYAFLSNDVSAFERQRRAFGLGEVSRMDLPNFGFFEILHRKPASFETVAEDYGLYQGQTVLKWKFVKF